MMRRRRKPQIIGHSFKKLGINLLFVAAALAYILFIKNFSITEFLGTKDPIENRTWEYKQFDVQRVNNRFCITKVKTEKVRKLNLGVGDCFVRMDKRSLNRKGYLRHLNSRIEQDIKTSFVIDRAGTEYTIQFGSTELSKKIAKHPEYVPTEEELLAYEPKTFKVVRAELKDVSKNISRILQQARMVPLFDDNNRVKGFQFVKISPNSFYTRYGFRQGDQLLFINGKSINSPQRAMEMWQEMKTATKIEVYLMRGELKIKHIYEIS